MMESTKSQKAQAAAVMPPAAERDIWTAQDVAEYLLVTARHVTNLAKRGELKGRQFGNVWRFRRQDIVELR